MAMSAAKATVRRIWSALGPGLNIGAADNDPSGIATYSQARAQFGFALTWTDVPDAAVYGGDSNHEATGAHKGGRAPRSRSTATSYMLAERSKPITPAILPSAGRMGDRATAGHPLKTARQLAATGVLTASKDWRLGAISRADIADFLARSTTVN
jgi:hypothetical protein